MKLNLKNDKTSNVKLIELIHEGAVWLHIESKCWGNTKRIPLEKFQNITQEDLSEWVKSNKGLVDNKALEDIHSHITLFRNTIKMDALPCPIEGIYIIPKEKIVHLCEKLNEIVDSFQIAINDFVKNYEIFINKAEEELSKSDLFNRDDYPKDIKPRFDLNYRLFEMGVPGSLKNFAPDIYQDEMNKIQNLAEQTKHECILFLREGFAKIIKSIVGTLTGETDDGKSKRIRQNTIDKMDKFFETFKNQNIFKDDEFNKVIDDARKIISVRVVFPEVTVV